MKVGLKLFLIKIQKEHWCWNCYPNAGDLISEGALAIEMGADAEDISLTVHPHPTLETFANAAEVFEGTVTDLYIPKRKQVKISTNQRKNF